MQKSILLAAIQKEIQRHDFSYFVDEPPSVAQSGKGTVGRKPMIELTLKIDLNTAKISIIAMVEGVRCAIQTHRRSD